MSYTSAPIPERDQFDAAFQAWQPDLGQRAGQLGFPCGTPCDLLFAWVLD